MLVKYKKFLFELVLIFFLWHNFEYFGKKSKRQRLRGSLNKELYDLKRQDSFSPSCLQLIGKSLRSETPCVNAPEHSHPFSRLVKKELFISHTK